MFSWKNLKETLHVEPLDRYLFRGQTMSLGLKRVYGGQVLAQSLNAASRSVGPERIPHSMHGYFLRPGDVTMPIIYEVDPIRDGRSFSTRRVVARQKGEAIFNSSVSFQIRESGASHQMDLSADISRPDALPRDADIIDALTPKDKAKMFMTLRAFSPDVIDVRSPNLLDWLGTQPEPPRQGFWFRIVPEIGDDPIMHLTLLAYMSDKGLISTGVRPHLNALQGRNIMMASLDHAMWFQDDVNVNNWIYYDLDSPRSGRNRTLGRGLLYEQSGLLIASTAQEGLFRIYDKPKES